MRKTTPDCADDAGVGPLAERLGMTEFELFCTAYESWYARDASERRIEKHFVQYMFYGEIPFWVRHFTRSAPSSIREPTPTRGEASSNGGLFVRLLECAAGPLLGR